METSLGLETTITNKEYLPPRDLGILVSPQHILARIKGTGEGKSACFYSLTMTAIHILHFGGAQWLCSSRGGHHFGSGSCVAFLKQQSRLKINQDHLFILNFRDFAESELGLNGADLFVKQTTPLGKGGRTGFKTFDSQGQWGTLFICYWKTNRGNDPRSIWRIY